MDTGVAKGDKINPYATAAPVMMQMQSQPAQTGPQEGQKSTSKSGKPIVFRNGNWEYE
jgi:hypothetical protein